MQHINAYELIQTYTKERFDTISDILINDYTLKNAAIHIHIIKSATIADDDKNKNINARRYFRTLNKQWSFYHNKDKLSWIQQIEINNLKSTSIQIFIK